MPDLHTRQGLDRLVTVLDDNRSVAGTRLTAYADAGDGTSVELGSRLGEPIGTPTPINLNFDGVDVGYYELRICAPDGIIFPQDDSTFSILVHDSC